MKLTELEQKLLSYVDERRDRLVEIIRDVVRIPSENTHGLTEGAFPAGVIDQLTFFLTKVGQFSETRREKAPVHELYADHVDPVPVAITNIFTAPWGAKEPITVPGQCRTEMYRQTMPGERQQDVEREFLSWLDSIIASAPHLFAKKPQLEFPIRWLPGLAIPKSEPLVVNWRLALPK